jgi:hypothetical protein
MTSQADRMPLTDRIDRFQRDHREYVIGAPWATRSGLWEVSVRGQEGTAFYDNGRRMMDALEVRVRRAGGR